MLSVGITGGTIATEYGVFRAAVLIRDGRIAALLEDERDLPPTDERIDARGLVILPGGLDPHCHFREPGPIPREGWRHGTMSAAAGGVTSVLEYPQAEPPVQDLKTLALKRSLAEAGAVIDFGLWGGVIPSSIEHIPALHHAGVVGFKGFMHSNMSYFPGIDDALLVDAMTQVASIGSVLSVHSENGAILDRALERLLAAGRTDPRAHLESRPPLDEYEAVNRLIFLARYTGVRVHVPHVTQADVAELIAQAKRNGLSISAETCPQYLLMDEDELERLGPYARCGPPLRTRDNVERMWSYVLDGTIDYHASDHAPYTTEEKEAGWKNIHDAPPGLNGNQFAIPLVLSELYHNRGMPLDQFAQYSATRCAKRLGLFPRKGTIRIGADADLVIYNLDDEWTIDRSMQLSLHKWTPWHGRRCRAKVVRTIVRGQTVYDGRDICVAPGYGRFVTHHYGAEQPAAAETVVSQYRLETLNA